MKKYTKLLQKRNKCIYCNSYFTKSLLVENKLDENFYVKYISRELSFKLSKINKEIKVYKCKKCSLIQNDPWFNEITSNKIYSNIYGHHHKGWANLKKFIYSGKLPDHGKLLKILNQVIKIKEYCEYSCPFSGLIFEINKSKQNKLKILKNLIIELNLLKQTGFKNPHELNKINKQTHSIFKKIIKIQKNLNFEFNNYILYDNSNLCWGQNCNQNSINCKTLASSLFNNKIINTNYEKKFDIFGFFSTLDHTFNIKKILEWSLDRSKLVVINNHSDKNITKQHLFVLSDEFFKKAFKKNIYSFNITDLIGRDIQRDEIYFLCTKDKRIAKKIKETLLKKF